MGQLAKLLETGERILDERRVDVLAEVRRLAGNSNGASVAVGAGVANPVSEPGRRVYIAATFSARGRLRPVRDQLVALGYDVTASWLDEVHKPAHMNDDLFKRKLAIKDLVEAGAADILIQDTLTDTPTGGKYVEWGIGLGRFQRQTLLLVGPVVNIFHQLRDYQFVSWEACLQWLRK